MLRRQRDSTGVLRCLFHPKSHRRDLSAASVLRADSRKVMVREREGFLGWLRGIFNKAADKSNEDGRRSHEVAAAIVDRALQRDRPEIAVPEVVADLPRKVDVVNQKLGNFSGVKRSTMKFGDRKFRSVRQRDADECGRAQSTIQQLAIYTQQPSGVDLKEQTAGEETPERGKDSLRSSCSQLAPPDDEIHRAERIGGRGAIEFAARDDLDVAAHYRCYTSPRHCYAYRLASPWTRQPPALLLATYGPNRNISVPTRPIAACAANNSKPPVREPNMPEKRERKDEKKERDKKKEPVIRTERESIDSSESRAAMVAEDNPTGDPDAPFRYEWGVKLAEEEPAGPSDNDNFAEKGRRYVTKRLWGVNLTHSEPDVEGAAAPPTSDSPGRGAHEHRNASRLFESEDTSAEAGETEAQVPPKPKRASANEQTESRWRQAKDDESFSTRSSNGDFVASNPPTSSQALRRVMKAVPAMKEKIAPDDDYNVPEKTAANAEISAWQSLAMKAKPVMLAVLSATRPDKLESVSIRPEAPEPKLDVRVVRSVEDVAEDKQFAGFKLSSVGLKHVGPVGTPGLDNLSPNKKLHTASALRDPIDIVRRSARSPLVDPTSTDGSAREKDLKIASACPTSSGDSKTEKMNDDDISRQQDEQQTDLKSLDEEENSSSHDTSDSESTERILSPVQSHIASSGDQGQLNAESDVAKATNTIADEETEMATRQSHDVDRASTSTMEESAFEDKSARDGTERASSTISYSKHNRADSHEADHNVAKLDPTKSAESAEKTAESTSASAKDIVFDLNAKDAGDDNFGGRYVINGDYARVPGDPYPYSKENLAKWKMPMSRSLLYAPIKRQTAFLSGPRRGRSTLRNANDASANAAGKSYGSHAVGTVMETSGSGDGAMGAKNVGLASGFRASSRGQRVVPPDCDAADELGLRGWTEAFSRLDIAGAATANGKTSEAERGDNASLRAYHQ